MPNERLISGLVEPQGVGEDPLFHYTRTYLLFLQGLFKCMPEGSYRWCTDEHLTEIAITDQIPVPREVIEHRPALVTMRGPAQYANLTLDQMRDVSPHTGAKERTDLVACTMTINSIAKNGIEAQRIGWIVMRHIRTFKVMLQRFGRIHKIGDEVSIGPESSPGTLVQETDPTWSMVTVQSPFFFQWTERSAPNAELLKALETHMSLALKRADEPSNQARAEYRTVTLNPPTIRGRVIVIGPEVGHPSVGKITQTVKT